MIKSFSRRGILKVLSGRLARNIYLWIMLIWVRSDYQYSDSELLFTTLIYTILALLFYANNLVLIPRFLATKRYLRYFAGYLGLVAGTSFLYVLTYKFMLSFYPDNKLWKVSPLLSSMETKSLSAAAFLNEQPFYFVLLFVVGCIFAMSWYVMDYQRQQQVIETVRKKQLETELNFLKNQINPHFLFNTMNNLYTLTLKKSDHAPEIVFKLSGILRYLLYESNTTLVSFEKEKDMMQAYIDLELLRLSNKEQLHFEITSDRNYEIPPLLWVPVLENIFKHGTDFISDAYFIDYRFSIRNYVLDIYSRNKYKVKVAVAADGKKNHGIGTDNLLKRLELLFPGRFSATIGSEGNFFITSIKIKLNGWD